MAADRQAELPALDLAAHEVHDHLGGRRIRSPKVPFLAHHVRPAFCSPRRVAWLNPGPTGLAPQATRVSDTARRRHWLDRFERVDYSKAM